MSNETETHVSIHVGSGRTAVRLQWRRHGDDVYVHIGGGRDHIGAVALAGADSEGRNCGGAIRIPPHKEAESAERAAARIHEALGVNACVSAGFHVDGITASEIAEVLKNMDQAVDAFLARAVQGDYGKLST